MTIDAMQKSKNMMLKRGSAGRHSSNVLLRDKLRSETLQGMDVYYHIVKCQLLRFQSYTTGLFPRWSNDAEVGYVRDSLYCAITVWGLSSAYRRLDDDRGRSYELGQSCVKTMRGILLCWMRQSKELEEFKKNPSPENALHSKFHLLTGKPVASSQDYGHLQIDVVALYLILLVQMISGGLDIIFSKAEVDFVQNMVFYLERAYRTPDFGIWEYGTRYNDNTCELHASSIGMAKAALETVNGFNLYGSRGTPHTVILTDVDAHNRNRTTFESLLPRESPSKNTDAALLMLVHFPCFATHNDQKISTTVDKLVRKLKGKFGFKRFLRDGYGTVIHDKKRRLYKSGETKMFDNIECQWPMFYALMVINGVIYGKDKQVKEYLEGLQRVVIPAQDGAVLPEFYYVPEESVRVERDHPSTTQLQSSFGLGNEVLFLWGQSLFILARLLAEGYVLKQEIDPISRHLPASQRPRMNNRHSVFQGSIQEPVVQIALISESTKLQTMLSTYGIQTQTPHQVEPIQIWPSAELVKVFERLGKNDALKLTGRPARPLGVLGTSKFHRINGETILSYPLLFEVSDFYMANDPSVVIDNIKMDIAFVANRWKLAGRPTLCMLLHEENISGEQFPQILDLLVCLKTGFCGHTRVRLGRVQNLLSASCVEPLEFVGDDYARSEIKPLRDVPTENTYGSLHDISGGSCAVAFDANFSIEPHKNKPTPEIVSMIKQTPAANLHTLSKLLHLLQERHGWEFTVDDGVSLRQKLEVLWRQAAVVKNWYVVRYCAAVLRKVVDSLAPGVTTCLVKGKQLTVGVFGHEEILFDKPLTPPEIAAALFKACLKYNVPAAALEQELIIALSQFVANESELFAGILKIRIGYRWLIYALELYMKFDQRHASLYSLSPMEVKNLLHDLLSMRHFQKFTPMQHRQLNGALNRVPGDFYDLVWKVLEKTRDGIVVAGHDLPQQPTLSDMTLAELTFSLTVDQLLSNIKQPEYRQLVVELLMVISTILQRNPELQFLGKLDIDQLLRNAFELFAKDKGIAADESNMTPFYDLLPKASGGTASYLARAVVNVLLKVSEQDAAQAANCSVM